MRKRIINEVTSNSTSKGSYVSPLLPGLRDFGKPTNAPYTEYINDYDSALLDYDAQDGRMSTSKKKIKSIEKKAEKITNFIKNNPDSFAWGDEAGIINSIPTKNSDVKPTKATKKAKVNKLESIERAIKSVLKEMVHKNRLKKSSIKESDSSVTAGLYTGPVELGLKRWKDSSLKPFSDFVDTEFNHEKKQKTLRNNIKRIVGVWEKNPDGSYKQNDHEVHTVNEDLAVWFGKKKKPKGSKQPKGPWVDICRKVNGKHPPCGRSDADKGKYPKCRAAGVAGKMSDSSKKAACQQKRKAEKQDIQSGKGQKPIMTSYKPKKKLKEDIMNRRRMITESDVRRIVRRVLNEGQTAPTGTINLFCKNTLRGSSIRPFDMEVKSESEIQGGIAGKGFRRLFLEKKKMTLPGGVVVQDGATSGSQKMELDLVPIDRIDNYTNPDVQNSEYKDPAYAANSVYLIGISRGMQGSSDGMTYFCSIDAGSDPAWEDYLLTL
jgi:hypothetical protein